MSEPPPVVRLVPEDVPEPRRIALVPVVPDGDDEVVVPDPRLVAEPPPEDVEEDEPDPPDPDVLEPLEGGADRTGCCSEK